MNEFKIIGTVKSEKQRNGPHFPFHCPAEIHIKKEFLPALKNLEANSHIWVLCLYDPKEKEQLQVKPRRVDHKLGLFGTLALRTPNHPNPIGLTLTRLLKIEDNIIYVDRLDAFDGTPVIDIKPYYEHDIVLNPQMPEIKHTDIEQRQIALLELAANCHGEECPGAALAVKMIIATEALGINVTADTTKIHAFGDGCLADCLQGLCRARIANPPRFLYEPSEKSRVIWQTADRKITVSLMPNLPSAFGEILNKATTELFIIEE